MVLYHTEIIVHHAFGRLPFDGIFLDGNHGVDLFFVLSGFIITYVHRADFNRPIRLKRYFFNRFRRLYPSVWIVTAAAVVAYALPLHGTLKAAKLTLANVFTSALLLPQLDVPLVNVTWTLKYEIIFYVLFSALLINVRAGIVVMSLWFASILALLAAGIHYDSSLAFFYLRPICLEFGAGMASAVFITYFKRTNLFAAYVLLTSGITIFVGASLLDVYGHGIPFQDFIVFGLSSTCVVTSLVLIERSSRFEVWPALVKLGDASYSIYLVHFSIVTISISALAHLRSRLPTECMAIISATVAVALGIMFYSVVDKPIQRRLAHFISGATARKE